MSDKYILVGKETKAVDLMEWAKWFETANRHVARTQIGKRVVSTVFLGIDHAFGGGPPLLFETMTFDENGHQEDCRRYTTWAEAELGHMEMVEAKPLQPD